jgi:hypothetical protein
MRGMRALPETNLKRAFLLALIASIAASALVGIGVILFGNFGKPETKILLTTLTISYASILGLACGAYLETRRGKVLPVTGIVMAILSAILWIILIWYGTIQERLFIKLLFSTTLLAVACSHLSLISLARLDKNFLWSRSAAYISVGILTAVLFVLIWADPERVSELVSRGIGVLSIIVAALTIITPVFHKLSLGRTNEDIDEEIARLKARIEELEKQKAEVRETPQNEAEK